MHELLLKIASAVLHILKRVSRYQILALGIFKNWNEFEDVYNTIITRDKPLNN